MTTDLADDVNTAALETLVLGELEQHLAINRTRLLGKRPPREEERMKMWAGGRRKKKPEILGGPAEGGPAEVCPAEVGLVEGSPAVVLLTVHFRCGQPQRVLQGIPRVPRQGSAKATRVAKVEAQIGLARPKSGWPPKIRKAMAQIGQGNAGGQSWPKSAWPDQNRGLATKNPQGNRPRQRGWPKLAQIGSTQQKTAQIGQFKVVAKIGKAVAKVGLAVAKQGRGQTEVVAKLGLAKLGLAKLGLAKVGHSRVCVTVWSGRCRTN